MYTIEVPICVQLTTKGGETVLYKGQNTAKTKQKCKNQKKKQKKKQTLQINSKTDSLIKKNVNLQSMQRTFTFTECAYSA